MITPSRRWQAPAKVNLTLHVLARRDDGLHELDSVVAFAGCGDWLRFEPGGGLSLTIEGPTAGAAGPLADNLVLRAARALAERASGIRLGRFHLRKNLPVAAGLGGGSSNAAAASASSMGVMEPKGKSGISTGVRVMPMLRRVSSTRVLNGAS